MNQKHAPAKASRKLVPRFAPNLGKTPTAFNFLTLTLAALLLISATDKVRAVCQTPQFGLPVILTVTRPIAAAAGDFNRDGAIDIAILKTPSNSSLPVTVEVFSGNGNGAFASTGVQYTAFPTGFSYDLVTADFNRDGRLDLAATGDRNLELAILLGNESGGFNPSVIYNADDARAINVGDFNNDGNVDLISRGYEAASIFPGHGNGTFGAAIVVAMGGNGYTRSVTTSDFNNDGLLDFTSVLVNTDVAPIRLGSGNFIFSSPPPIASPNASEATVNDFNRDGKPDVAVVRDAFAGSVSINLGSGSGTFSPSSGSPFLTNGTYSQAIISGDFNSDNIPDIAVGNESVSNSLSILLNNGAGVFGTGFNLSPGQNHSERLYTFDFNRNGVTDLIVVKEVAENQVVVMPNVCAPSGRAKFDFDGDGKSDVSVFRPSSGAWFLNQSQNGFTGVTFGLGTDKLAPADYDGDGKTDVAVVRNGIWYLLRSQAGFTGISFGDSNDIPQPADYDGDGKAELAIFRPSNGYWYFLNLNGNQTSLVPFGASIDKPVAADYDGDGKTDLAVYRSGVWYLLRSQLGYAGIIFGDAADKPVTGDYDGDGRADIAVFRPSNGTWYLNRSTLGITGIAFGAGTDAPVPADYDGDGKTDIAVFRGGIWYLNRSQAGFTGITFGAPDDRPVPNAFVP